MGAGRPTPEWVGRTRVVFVVGKGGVGTSTVAASLSLLAAGAGADVLLVSIDGKPGLGTLLGGEPIGEREQVLRTTAAGGRIRARSVTPAGSFRDYLDLRGFGGVLRRIAAAASFDVIAGATPGMEHLLVLGKVKELDREAAADLIVVDAPPAGHAAPFLRSAGALQVAVASGPIRDQADEVAALLADHDRCQCLLVTLPEETPVNEAVELVYDLEETLGLALAPLVVNGCWPERAGLRLRTAIAAKQQRVTVSASDRRALDDSSRFGWAQLERQRRQLDRLDEALPLPRVQLPRLPVARLRTRDLDELVVALAVDPVLPAVRGGARR